MKGTDVGALRHNRFMARSLTLVDIARVRLSAQHILGTDSTDPVNAVRAMTAMQGQDLPGTLWAIGLRARVTELEVREAFDRGRLVRSWPMRGTLHATTPDDLRLLLPLSRDRVVASLAARHRDLEISSDDVVAASRAAVAGLTNGPSVLSRKDLLAVFERSGQATGGQRGIHLVFMLAHAGLLCLGPFLGKEQGYVLLDEWAPVSGQPPSRSDALATVALRYFSSHGPATVEDFAWWAKLTLTDARAGAAAVRDELAVLNVSSTEYLASRDIAERATHPPGGRTALLLPGFDEFILGYTDRSAALAPEHAPLIVPGNNGVFKPTVVIGGRVVGTWSRKDRTSQTAITARLFRELTPTETRGIARAVQAYGRFRSLPATIADVSPTPVDAPRAR